METIFKEKNITPESVDPTATLTKLMESESFEKSDYASQIRQIAKTSVALYGYCLPEDSDAESEVPVIDVNFEKPWGAYVTLSKEHLPEGDLVRKILIVRPKPTPIPSSWNLDEPFAQTVVDHLGKLGTALSFQRHHHRIKEVWKVIAGEQSYHVTADDNNGKPDLTQTIVFKEINADKDKRIATHNGDTWHTVVNAGNSYLIIKEAIYCQPGMPHDETDIERANDYVSNRAGTNENI